VSGHIKKRFQVIFQVRKFNAEVFLQVHRTKGWKDIAAILGIISPNPNTAYTLKKQYIKFVLPYEARFDRGKLSFEETSITLVYCKG
jgi:hypothetical protein